MAQRLATPGVYIEEKNAFPSSVAGLPTAIPVFIGYTEKAVRAGRSLLQTPVRIGSLAEYHSFFGGNVHTKFNIEVQTDPTSDYDFTLEKTNYRLLPAEESRFIFYSSMKHFFANGGSTCYVISVGYYENTDENGVSTSNKFDKAAILQAIAGLIKEEEPTMLVVPEAVMLEEADCAEVQQAMLQHCGYKMRNRFAIFDVYDGFKARTYDDEDVITRFRENIGSNFLDFGAAYYPWVYTTVVDANDVSVTNIQNTDLLIEILEKEVDLFVDIEKKAEEIKKEIRKIENPDVDKKTLSQTLSAISGTFKLLMGQLRKQLNILPPSAAMAGIYTMVDTTRGVHKAPANVSLSATVGPTLKMTNDDQEDLNVTVSGKSINAIRSFIGEGTLVWGARTLDGNSQDWRYINVRRTMIYIEQSIKYAAKPYIYEPNNANTWVSVRSMVSGFLTDLWKQGGLAGGSAAEAFEVGIGLGETMTPNDILDGIMRVSVKVAITRPAEFIVITFQQKMQES